MTPCVEIRLLLPRFLSLDLQAGEEEEVREHLHGCRGCRRLLAIEEPAAGLAMSVTNDPVDDADGFVAGVLAGVHQRSVERRLSKRRHRWLMAAAATVLLVLGGAALRERGRSAPAPAVVATIEAPPVLATSDPAFVEVEGKGIRVYQLASGSKDTVQVAFIVDPHLEL